MFTKIQESDFYQHFVNQRGEENMIDWKTNIKNS